MKATEFDKKTSIKAVKSKVVAEKQLAEQPKRVKSFVNSTETFSVAGVDFEPGSHTHRHMQADTALWRKMQNWD